MSRCIAAAALVAAMAAGNAASAADPENGRRLHATYCADCHASLTDGEASTLYTRPGRQVNSLRKLYAQVRRCRDNLGLTWFDDQVEDVVAYLDKTYYHFKE